MYMHRCPKRGCRVQLQESIFSCKPHWYDLSEPVRDAIWATKNLGLVHPDRQAAIKSAREEWGDIDGT